MFLCSVTWQCPSANGIMQIFIKFQIQTALCLAYRIDWCYLGPFWAGFVLPNDSFYSDCSFCIGAYLWICFGTRICILLSCESSRRIPVPGHPKCLITDFHIRSTINYIFYLFYQRLMHIMMHCLLVNFVYSYLFNFVVKIVRWDLCINYNVINVAFNL